MDKALLDDRKAHYARPIIKVKRPTLPYIPSDKASRRVIAPYINIVRKNKKIALKDETSKYIKAFLQKKPSILMSTLKEFLDGIVELPILIHESIDALKAVTNSIGTRLYIVDEFLHEIFISPKENPFPTNRLSLKIETGKSVAAHVAATQEVVLSEDILVDSRFSDGVPFVDLTLKSVLSAPILTETGVCYGVVELYRDCRQKPFKSSDTKIVLVVLGWIGSSICKNNERIKVLHQKQLNECLIELTRTYFSNNLSIDNFISEVVKFVKSAVNAEKVSLFIMHPDNELIADIYDQGLPDYGGDLVKRLEKIKLAKEKGIVSYVAKTKTGVLVKDIATDPMFHREVDADGLITKSVLCVPILSMESLLGIILGINKATADCFTEVDEDIFRTFSIYCSLCLQHYNLSKAHNAYRAHYEIMKGLLKRHVLPNEYDLAKLRSKPDFSEDVEKVNQFDWYINLNKTDEMPQIAVHLVMSVVDEGDIDVNELYKFVLSMRMFYRKNLYHNWEHGFNVCHCMSTILRHNMKVFTSIERKALVIAALGHDVDHGGVTNGFLRLTNDVMAELYEESTWECHHYEVTMILLSEIPIYKNSSQEEYKMISEVIHSAIIATDLVNYFKTSAKLRFIIDDNNIFDIEHPVHRLMMIGVMMTVADLSGQCKSFNITNRITMNLYEEFYNQGDREKGLGYVPLAMMDRDKISAIPTDQVHFLQVLVIPCCELLTQLLPNTYPLCNAALKLKKVWTNIVEKNDTKWWSPDPALSEKLHGKY